MTKFVIKISHFSIKKIYGSQQLILIAELKGNIAQPFFDRTHIKIDGFNQTYNICTRCEYMKDIYNLKPAICE